VLSSRELVRPPQNCLLYSLILLVLAFRPVTKTTTATIPDINPLSLKSSNMASTTAAISCPKIMQRSSSANQGAAVCGVTEKENAAVLRNKGVFQPAAVMMLVKEGKKNDKALVISTTDERAAPKEEALKKSNSSDYQDDAATLPIGNETAWNPLEEVDSALLAALCDTRERKALYRLEQVILDFMKDNSSEFIEVGGAFNSIVLRQNSHHGFNNGETPDVQAFSNQGHLDLLYQQQRGLRQTSFQRLILHRLADRFCIMREQVNNATNSCGNEGGLVDVGPSQSGQPPSFSPGLIRLVKTSESFIPPHLLTDVDLDLLIDFKNPRARNSGGSNANASTANAHVNNYEEVAKSLSDNITSTTLEAPLSAGGIKKSKKKMIIMKRNTASESRGSIGGKGKGKQTGISRRKKLEDREKAYEEARARIFGMNEASGNSSNGGCDESTAKVDRSPVPQREDPQDNTMARMHSCHSSLLAQNEVNALTAPAPGEQLVSSQATSAISTTDHSSPSSPELQGEGDQQPASPLEAAATESSVPAAITSGAIFKAVYRNRQQEENDPDFKRTSDVRPTYAPYVANHYGVPMAYANPALGQQPTSQLPAMQLQQAHQSHFYHGVHAAKQVQIPQDATAYATNVDNNPLTHWATAPSRGYYPSPQQEGQHEKHQAWQLRSQNNCLSQVLPNSTSSSISGNIYTAKNNSLTKQPTIIDRVPGTQRHNDKHEEAVSKALEGLPNIRLEEKSSVYQREKNQALTSPLVGKGERGDEI